MNNRATHKNALAGAAVRALRKISDWAYCLPSLVALAGHQRFSSD